MATTYGTEPVKLIPARCGDFVIASPKTGPSAGMKFCEIINKIS